MLSEVPRWRQLSSCSSSHTVMIPDADVFGSLVRYTLISQVEKAMAPHSSTLAWRIPGTGEPGRLPSMGLHRVGHDWSDLAAAASLKLMRSGLCLSLRCHLHSSCSLTMDDLSAFLNSTCSSERRRCQPWPVPRGTAVQLKSLLWAQLKPLQAL